jgi:acrylyl-CoA reductase (NADPH)/3-hydroxypropionyl-CoA dehydratase/3-hydroxypropionyl-CoA synthetase
VPAPGAQEALLYMLTSEINFNDIWAITGVPVSPFDNHDEDWHVTGSGGLGLVAARRRRAQARGAHQGR